MLPITSGLCLLCVCSPRFRWKCQAFRFRAAYKLHIFQLPCPQNSGHVAGEFLADRNSQSARHDGIGPCCWLANACNCYDAYCLLVIVPPVVRFWCSAFSDISQISPVLVSRFAKLLQDLKRAKLDTLVSFIDPLVSTPLVIHSICMLVCCFSWESKLERFGESHQRRKTLMMAHVCWSSAYVATSLISERAFTSIFVILYQDLFYILAEGAPSDATLTGMFCRPFCLLALHIISKFTRVCRSSLLLPFLSRFTTEEWYTSS